MPLRKDEQVTDHTTAPFGGCGALSRPGQTLRSLPALTAAGLLAVSPAEPGAEPLEAVIRRYPVAIPPTLAALIPRASALDSSVYADPIGRQVLPHPAELITAPEEVADPTGDAPHSPLPGVVHRYPDRVLLLPTTTCAVYCRFCFRRERVGGSEGLLAPQALDAALAYIAARPQVWEVILSGGDPLTLTPARLETLLRRLQAIPHLGILRLHSRVPLAAPERITPALLQALGTEKPLYLVLHANHAREFTPAGCAALRQLAGAGVQLLGQSVLLAGVNDDAEVLAALMRRFLENRVRPYYLHHLDPAPGTARFRVPLARGQALVQALRGRLSGLAQPSYVLDIPGGYGKSPVGPAFLDPDSQTLRDWQGHWHRL